MKFKLYIKDPDGISDSIQDAVAKTLDDLDLTAREHDALEEIRGEWVSDICSKWIGSGENIVIEIDTKAGTAVVIPQ